MVCIGTSHISDAGVLVEMAPERVTRVNVAKVTKGDPRTTKNVVMETVNRWQSEIGVRWIDLESIHDCCDAYAVSPYVPYVKRCKKKNRKTRYDTTEIQ